MVARVERPYAGWIARNAPGGPGCSGVDPRGAEGWLWRSVALDARRARRGLVAEKAAERSSAEPTCGTWGTLVGSWLRGAVEMTNGPEISWGYPDPRVFAELPRSTWRILRYMEVVGAIFHQDGCRTGRAGGVELLRRDALRGRGQMDELAICLFTSGVAGEVIDDVDARDIA